MNAEEIDTDSLVKKISPDLKNATFYMKEPTTMEESDFAISGYVNNILAGDGYNVIGSYQDGKCTIEITSLDYSSYSSWDDEVGGLVEHTTGWGKKYELNVSFVEPKTNSTINNYFNKLNNFNPMDSSTYYIIEDLSLINYYLTSNKSELWNSGSPGRALKYSTLNDLTSGSNITYYLEIRAGSQDETLMYESAFGPMSIFYNGYSYGTKEEGLYLKRVIYIPQTTADTKEAYIEAAQKRINDYLGNSSVVVSYGGLINSLDEGSEDEEYPITSDGNYYNVKVGSRTYKFYIIKGTDAQLVEPTYTGLDLDSKIEITSEDSTIPLDTSLTVKNIEDNSIKDKIGTNNYKSYDISLYSDAKGSKIEKLENGKFLVKIPVPTELDGKELIVYYITSEGNTEEHEVTIKDGYATFETDHFSIYTLAEKTSSSNTTTSNNTSTINNPQTSDNVITYVVTLIVSLIGVACAIVYFKKNKLVKSN